MASTLENIATVREGAASSPEPQLLRFGLKQLFLMMSAASVLCFLLAATDGPWPWIIAFFASLVLAHVAGNLIGTRLRDTSEEVRHWRSANSAIGPDQPASTPPPVRWAELGIPLGQPLASHEPAPRRLQWLIGAVAAASAIAGTAALAWFAGPHAGWAAVLVGGVSCAVIGAWAALLASSFWAIARHAWRHAQGKVSDHALPAEAARTPRRTSG